MHLPGNPIGTHGLFKKSHRSVLVTPSISEKLTVLLTLSAAGQRCVNGYWLLATGFLLFAIDFEMGLVHSPTFTHWAFVPAKYFSQQ